MADAVLYRNTGQTIRIPFYNKDGGIPDITQITAATIQIYDQLGGSNTLLAGLSIGSGITLSSDTAAAYADCHWTQAQMSANGNLNAVVFGYGTLFLSVASAREGAVPVVLEIDPAT